MEHVIALQNATGRVSLLQVGQSCVWASSENEKICMIHAQVLLFETIYFNFLN
jgi:hypothetical protein